MSYLTDAPFKNGLVFGDPAQIAYLKEWNNTLAEEEAKRNDGLRLWSVDVCETHHSKFEIWADDEFTAIEEAGKKLDFEFDCSNGSEYEIMDVTEIPE